MQDLGGGPGLQPSLVDRAKNILLKPNEEWTRIDAEPTTIGDIYRSHVIPLAAIGPLCGLIGALLFGYGFLGIVYRPSVVSAVSHALIQYALTLVMVYVLALVIDALAPTFQGTKNQVQAFKVAAYSATASWLGGVFGLIPQLAILSLLAGLYSLYLLYLGLPKLMKVTQEKAVGYIAVIILATIVLFLILGALTASVAGLFGGYGRYGDAGGAGAVSGALTVPGVGSVDLAKLEAASKQMEATAKSMEASANGTAAGVAAIAPTALQDLLPAALPGGLARTSVSSSSAGAAGIGGTQAEAQYGGGAGSIKLALTDLGAAGALAALGSAFNVQSSTQNAEGYEKIGKVDGRMTTEKWSNASRSGSYSVLVGDRFMVAADGDGASIDALKAAVAQIDLGALERLAKS